MNILSHLRSVRTGRVRDCLQYVTAFLKSVQAGQVWDCLQYVFCILAVGGNTEHRFFSGAAVFPVDGAVRDVDAERDRIRAGDDLSGLVVLEHAAFEQPVGQPAVQLIRESLAQIAEHAAPGLLLKIILGTDDQIDRACRDPGRVCHVHLIAVQIEDLGLDVIVLIFHPDIFFEKAVQGFAVGGLAAVQAADGQNAFLPVENGGVQDGYEEDCGEDHDKNDLQIVVPEIPQPLPERELFDILPADRVLGSFIDQGVVVESGFLKFCIHTAHPFHKTIRAAGPDQSGAVRRRPLPAGRSPVCRSGLR